MANKDKIELGECWHADLLSYKDQLTLKGKRRGILFSRHVEELARLEIFAEDLRMLGRYHPDCYVANDIFFYSGDVQQYLQVWEDAGSAYREIGFYHFITQMGEAAPEIK